MGESKTGYHVGSSWYGAFEVETWDENEMLFSSEDGSNLCMFFYLVVATDDEKIAACCREFGANVIMTSESCQNGIDCC